jgi:YgiT-type zinc finger domain-containing protein
MSKFGYQCEWCTGTVHEKVLAREVFHHARGFVMLEEVPVGVCDHCGRKYYSAKVLRRVEDVALHHEKAERSEPVPVAHA